MQNWVVGLIRRPCPEALVVFLVVVSPEADPNRKRIRLMVQKGLTDQTDDDANNISRASRGASPQPPEGSRPGEEIWSGHPVNRKVGLVLLKNLRARRQQSYSGDQELLQLSFILASDTESAGQKLGDVTLLTPVYMIHLSQRLGVVSIF